ncbi:MAG: efflux RND transporter periplasmic adaptor subunit [Myxococcota bacterium]
MIRAPMIAFLVTLLLLPFCLPSCGGESTRGEPGATEPSAAAKEAELYSCGMHPNVVHEGPGRCPICGMELTPVRGGGSAPTRSSPSGERKIKYWVAPMDPTYISDKPGKSPMGMDLVPVYEDEVPASAEGSVVIDPAVQQNMGVRTERVLRATVFRHVRSIGQVEVGEDRISVVNLRVSGWVERIFVDRTGDPVERGQALFELYSPELVSAQGEYLLALRAHGPKSELARSARRKLDLWGIDDQDIAALTRSRRVRRVLPIRSPRTGHVLEKHVFEGAHVPAGADVYRIGDLSRIWVTAEIYEFDAPWIKEGLPAQMELPHEAGRVLEGEVAYIYPTLNEVSRTLTVRLEFENPDIRLKPGMFATVYIQYRRRDDVLAIPNEAILDSGRRKLVFVAKPDGHFEPREIVTGLAGDHNVTEVLSGLEAGEEVVVSGQFLLDSESQLQEAIRKMLARRSGTTELSAESEPPTLYACPMHPDEISTEPGRCSLCGMDLEERGARPGEFERLHTKHEHEHAHVQDADEGRYSCPMHPDVVASEPGRCPICGMFLEKSEDPEEPVR